MDSRILLESGGFPVYIRDLVALQDNVVKTLKHLVFSNTKYTEQDLSCLILYGDIYKSDGKVVMKKGALYIDGDIYPMEDQELTYQPDDAVYVKVMMTTSDVRIYKDGMEHAAVADYKAVLSTVADGWINKEYTSFKRLDEVVADNLCTIVPSPKKLDFEPSIENNRTLYDFNYIIEKGVDGSRHVRMWGYIQIDAISSTTVGTYTDAELPTVFVLPAWYSYQGSGPVYPSIMSLFFNNGSIVLKTAYGTDFPKEQYDNIIYFDAYVTNLTLISE